MASSTDPEISKVRESKFLESLNSIITLCVKCLAVFMVLIIVLGVVDVALNLYYHMITPPYFMLDMNKYLEVLGSFLAVMVGLEIFMNIIFYLKEDSIHVPLVLSTALTAIARKIIVIDYSVLTPQHVYATGVVIFAVGLVYWLITGTKTK